MTWPTIPAELLLPPRKAATVTAAPPGRVIAVLECDDEKVYAVAADGAAVRRVDVGAPQFADMDAQLSPDGTRIAVAGDRELFVQDLASGSVSAFPFGSIIGVNAWSPDGKQVAVDLDEVLAVVDLTDGSHRVVSTGATQDFYAAAFGAGGVLAIGVEEGTVLALPDGRLVTVSNDHELAGPGAFSPDGTLLALTLAPDWPPAEDPDTFELAVFSLDGEPRLAAAPVEVTGYGIDVLGWRSDGQLLVSDHGPDGVTVFGVGLDGTRADPLTTCGPGIEGIAVATGLIRELRQRPAGEPDYGTSESRGWLRRG